MVVERQMKVYKIKIKLGSIMSINVTRVRQDVRGHIKVTSGIAVSR